MAFFDDGCNGSYAFRMGIAQNRRVPGEKLSKFRRQIVKAPVQAHSFFFIGKPLKISQFVLEFNTIS
jgi:hypothetical protein